MNRTRLYFDHAATSPLLPSVGAAMAPFWSETFGNASSPYATSRAARMALDEARTRVARAIGAHADEIAWTSGGTESDNWALWGTALAHLGERGHIVVSAIEHHAVLEPAKALRELGFDLDFARANADGVVEPHEIARLLRSDTRIVSLLSLNNETGVRQPIREVARLLRERGVPLHVDATQSLGKEALDVDLLDENGDLAGEIALVTLSAHKVGGPKGVGALYIRRGAKMRPFLRGGAQERGRRAGTENVPGIVGFGVAAHEARENGPSRAAHMRTLRERLEAGLCERGAHIIGAEAPRGPHICAFVLPEVRAESLALRLDLAGIAVGTGSACASGALEPSHVLGAMGYDARAAKSALRVSFGPSNTPEEVDELLESLP